jgi:hypothetical protein
MQDRIATSPDLGMGTQAGGLALVGSVSKTNASIVDKVSFQYLLIIRDSIGSDVRGVQRLTRADHRIRCHYFRKINYVCEYSRLFLTKHLY